MRQYINSVSNFKLGKWFNGLVKYVIPILLLIIIGDSLRNEFISNYEGYPDWALRIGWGLILIQAALAVGLSLSKGKEKSN